MKRQWEAGETFDGDQPYVRVGRLRLELVDIVESQGHESPLDPPQRRVIAVEDLDYWTELHEVRTYVVGKCDGINRVTVNGLSLIHI